MRDTAARVRRNVAVRLIAMTLSQSSSRSCTNRLSRLTPALTTRMSSFCIFSSALGTSASTHPCRRGYKARPALDRQVPRQSFQERLCACRRAQRPHLEREAHARLHHRLTRWLRLPVPSCQSNRTSWVPPRLEGSDVLRTAYGAGGRAPGKSLDQSAQYLSSTNFVEIRDARIRHVHN